jgi:hypothetical protein
VEGLLPARLSRKIPLNPGANRRMICPKCQSLLFYLQEDGTGRKECAFWGWTEAERIEIVERRRYDGNRIIAAAFLLRFLSRSAASPNSGRSFRVWYGESSGSRLSWRRREIKTGLHDLGYRPHTLRWCQSPRPGCC